jgi:hypothetical protein
LCAGIAQASFTIIFPKQKKLIEKNYLRDVLRISKKREAAYSKAISFALVSFALLFSTAAGGGLLLMQPAFASSQATLTIKALDQNRAIQHVWTIITQNGKTVSTGNTPLSFPSTVGQTYTAMVSSTSNVVFLHWASGSANNVRTVTLAGSMTLVADYQAGSTPPPTQKVGSITASLSSKSVAVGQSVTVSGKVFDTTSTVMPNVKLAITWNRSHYNSNFKLNRCVLCFNTHKSGRHFSSECKGQREFRRRPSAYTNSKLGSTATSAATLQQNRHLHPNVLYWNSQLFPYAHEG